MKTIIRSFILSSLIAFGCSPATKITGSWTSPDKNPSGYSSIFVAAIVDNMQARQKVEDDFRRKLEKLGLSATSGSSKIKPTFWEDKAMDKEAIMDIIKTNGYDAILTMTLLEKESEQRYVPGSVMYNPTIIYGWGWPRRGNFGGYWAFHYPMMASPGYIVEDKEYTIEINLYDASTELLVWSAQSKTLNPSSLEEFSEEFSTVVIEKMLEDRIISNRR